MENIEDPYIWMENLNDKRVLKFIEEENKHFKRFIGNLPEKLINEVRKYNYLPNIEKAQITERGIYIMINEAERQLIKILETGEIIVDSKNLEKEIGDEVVLQDFFVDKKGKKLAYNFSIGGADEGVTRIIDLETRRIVEEIKPSIWNIIFLEDGYYFVRFYRKEKTPDGMKPPAERVFLKREKEEVMIFGEGFGSGYFMDLYKSTDDKWIMLVVSFGWNKADIYLSSIDNPKKWKKVYSSNTPAYPIDVINGKLYVYTREGKGLGKIIAIKNGKIEEIIPEDKFPLEWAVIVNNKILTSYLIHASSKLRVFTLDGKFIEDINFDIPGRIFPIDHNKKLVLLKYESFTIPYRLYRFKNKLELIDKIEIDEKFEVSEDFAISKDGTRVHYFIVKKKGEKSDKAWVLGYGGFNIALLPKFIPIVIPFIERGGIFVMTNIRGGSEYGEEWHRAGMRENKQNVFNDFIAVLEKLRKEGYKVVAFGKSNGGLLVSAVLVQRPDIIDVAIIGYPIIDMLRFHKLYIGSIWIPEYGNPDDPKDREFLLKYSPYHNIKPKKYPPTLIYTGLHDDRVHPAHAFKFTAKLKDVGAPVYLRIETKSGHIGASPETKVKELTDILAFVFKVLKIKI